MGSSRYRLFELLELLNIQNSDSKYGIEYVRGVNNQKKLMPTKADLLERDISKFQVVMPQCFVFNHRTSRNGSKFSIAFNDTDDPIICTEDYVVFRVNDQGKKIIDPVYLYLFFCRPEFDRYVITNSWGSSTEFYNWSDICDIELDLPPLHIQQKYVDIYKALVANQKAYEAGLDDLKLTCDAYIEQLRRKMPCEKIGPYIERKNIRNILKSNSHVMGLSTLKEFRVANSRVNREELAPYKIVSPKEIAFVPTTDTWRVLAFAVNTLDHDIVVSPIYEVFSVDEEKIIVDFLAIWLKRKEFDRYARFHSWGSARETFAFEDMCDVEIPIPSIEVQRSIVNIYKAYIERKKINEELKSQIKNICPILIKGSLEEAKRA